MGLRTSEQLLELFRERKRIQEKKQLQKQKQKQEQKQLLLQVRKERQKRLKQAEQQLKAETTIEITIAIPTDYSDDENLFQTREELHQWEQEHWPCINWNRWNEIVEKTKNLCQNIPKL